MEFILANTKDIDELVRMRFAYVKEDMGGVDETAEQEMTGALRDYFERHLGNDLVVFAAKEDGRLLSTAYLLMSERPYTPPFKNGLTGTVLSVYTMPEYRRQGIAKSVLSGLIAYAKERGISRIDLLASADGAELYKQLGFSEHITKYTSMRLTIE